MQQRPLDGARSRLLQTLRDDPALPGAAAEPAARRARAAGRSRRAQRRGELMALAPTRNLLQALDESLWKSPLPGGADVFDADELVDWLEAWNEIGDDIRRRSARSDERRVSRAVPVAPGQRRRSSHARVPRHTGRRSGSSSATRCSRSARACSTVRTGRSGDRRRMGRRARVARRPVDATVPSACCTRWECSTAPSRCSPRRRARQRLTIDVARERERHRENLGYVTAPGACAFLVFVATASIEELAALRAYDEETRRHLAAFGASR